jgi:ketosteroid isomerase-like protein
MNGTIWRHTLLTGLLIGSLLACTNVPAADPSRTQLEAAIHRWTAAVNARDTATLSATMTEDVELSNSLGTAKGRDAALRTLSEVAADGQLIATTRELTIADDLAWHLVGLSQVQKNGDVRARGQALEIWKRVKGEWQLHRRMAAEVSPGLSLTRPPANEPVLDEPRQ